MHVNFFHIFLKGYVQWTPFFVMFQINLIIKRKRIKIGWQLTQIFKENPNSHLNGFVNLVVLAAVQVWRHYANERPFWTKKTQWSDYL